MKPFVAVEIEAPGDLFFCHSGTYGIQNERNRLLWACVVSDDAIETLGYTIYLWLVQSALKWQSSRLA